MFSPKAEIITIALLICGGFLKLQFSPEKQSHKTAGRKNAKPPNVKIETRDSQIH